MRTASPNTKPGSTFLSFIAIPLVQNSPKKSGEENPGNRGIVLVLVSIFKKQKDSLDSVLLFFSSLLSRQSAMCILLGFS
ncbi:hypothetical protein LEP1GSC034_3824 [Leptospira interrogans str. 2003000735]|nr:hypothetical protein LEP1GSC034_3824 [Leptospira interrogans str. 2003000735]